jgi:hypothetical protein
MSKVFREAIARVELLSEADQDRIARELIGYIDKLNALRADVAAGIRELDAGQGRPLDIEDVLRQARAKHGKGSVG